MLLLVLGGFVAALDVVELLELEDVDALLALVELGALLDELVDDPFVVLLSESPQAESEAIIAHSAICPRTDLSISLSLEC